MIRRTPQAEDEIVDAAWYIALDRPSAADRFIAAINDTLRFLYQAPGVGRALEFQQLRLAGSRVWSVRGFPNHLLVYRPMDDGIELLHVVHGARDPGRLLAEE